MRAVVGEEKEQEPAGTGYARYGRPTMSELVRTRFSVYAALAEGNLERLAGAFLSIRGENRCYRDYWNEGHAEGYEPPDIGTQTPAVC